MKSVNEIIFEIGKILQDARTNYPPANIFSNAPLALIQTSLESRLLAFMWMIEGDEDPEIKRVFNGCEAVIKMWKIAKDHNAN